MKKTGIVPWLETIGFNALRECITEQFSLQGLPLQILTCSTNMATMCRSSTDTIETAASFPALHKLAEKFGKLRRDDKKTDPAGTSSMLYH